MIDDGCHEVIWIRLYWLTMEQDTRKIKFQDINMKFPMNTYIYM